MFPLRRLLLLQKKPESIPLNGFRYQMKNGYYLKTIVSDKITQQQNVFRVILSTKLMFFVIFFEKKKKTSTSSCSHK